MAALSQQRFTVVPTQSELFVRKGTGSWYAFTLGNEGKLKFTQKGMSLLGNIMLFVNNNRIYMEPVMGVTNNDSL